MATKAGTRRLRTYCKAKPINDKTEGIRIPVTQESPPKQNLKDGNPDGLGPTLALPYLQRSSCEPIICSFPGWRGRTAAGVWCSQHLCGAARRLHSQPPSAAAMAHSCGRRRGEASCVEKRAKTPGQWHRGAQSNLAALRF